MANPPLHSPSQIESNVEAANESAAEAVIFPESEHPISEAQLAREALGTTRAA